jgi:hypothetical protein
MDINMKKLLVLASAASALAIASGASAYDFQINLQGNVSSLVSVTGVISNCTTGSCTPSMGGGNTQNINLALADTNGHPLATTGSTTIQVNANQAFETQVYSQFGGLTPCMWGGCQIVPYAISVTGNDASKSQGHGSSDVNNNPSNAVIGHSTAGAASSVIVEFQVSPDPSTTLDPGNYTDTLYVTFRVS